MSRSSHPAQAALAGLKTWLTEDAYPLWWERGIDREWGGFYEKIDQGGTALTLPKRARVQPRQIYCFSQAASLGWQGDAAGTVRAALDFYLRHYWRDDGLVRTLVAPDGAPLKDEVDFYDQAFALLGLHSAYVTLGFDPALKQRAHRLIARWTESFKHPVLGFEEAVPRRLPLCSNPHMHLFESCLAWAGSDADGPWLAIADEIGRLALTHFIDRDTGALREFFAGDWQPMPGDQGRVVEPGHQLEWAWLLMRWGSLTDRPAATTAALRLIAIAENYGADPVRGVAFNSLWDDLTPHDRRARLWPQTERIKAHCLAAELTGDARHWQMAVKAADGLRRYFATPMAGLWRDMMLEDGGFIEEAAPASSFYHIVCAIAEFERAVTAG